MSFWRDLNRGINAVLPTVAGIAGNLIVPGVGGAVAGAVTSGIVASGQSRGGNAVQQQAQGVQYVEQPVRQVQTGQGVRNSGKNTAGTWWQKNKVFVFIGSGVVLIGTVLLLVLRKPKRRVR